MTERSRLGRDPFGDLLAAAEPQPIALVDKAPVPPVTPLVSQENPLAHQENPPAAPENPLAVFLGDVLRSLLPDPGPHLQVTVAPEIGSLSGDRFYFFSQALQLLLSPVDLATILGRHHRPIPVGEDACVWVRLESRSTASVALRLFDDGNCLRHYFPDLRLDLESLRPLLLFLARKKGSLVLKQGHCVEFEIIG